MKPDPMKPDYVLIVGQGRSGTNWLLDLLDLSSQTYCRNEANKLTPSPLTQLPSATVRTALGAEFAQEWDNAITAASMRMGERDRLNLEHKFYKHQPRLPGGLFLVSGKRRRQWLSVLNPELSQSDWAVPNWLLDLQKLKQALPVFKLNQVPGWASWVLQNRPEVLVIHIVRHPGGFLHSWKSRYSTTQEPDQVKQDNNQRLQRVAELDADWRPLVDHVNAMTIDESELWYWRYTSETIDSVGAGRSNYMRIIYEDLVSDPVVVTKLLYQKCQLPWTDEIEQKVVQGSSQSSSIASTWQSKLSAEQLDAIKRVVDGSFVCHWWENYDHLRLLSVV
jgi:hypothetical protein